MLKHYPSEFDAYSDLRTDAMLPAETYQDGQTKMGTAVLTDSGPDLRPAAPASSVVPRLRPGSPMQTPCLEKLNRHKWMAGVSFRSYGVKVGVRVNKPEALEPLISCFPPGWEAITDPDVDLLLSFMLGGAGPRSNVRQYHLAYLYHMRVARTMVLAHAILGFDQALNLGVAEHAPSRIFVHAGVVGWRGRAIVIPGRSYSGKSRLVAALVRAGATYYSDEYAVLDSKGRVHPFAKPLSIRQEVEAPPRLVTAEELGGRTGIAPLPVGLVLYTNYRAGVKWRPQRLSPGAGLLSLLDNTIPARRRPKLALRILRTVTEAAPVLKGSRGEANDVAGRIFDKLQALDGKRLGTVDHIH